MTRRSPTDRSWWIGRRSPCPITPMPIDGKGSAADAASGLCPRSRHWGLALEGAAGYLPAELGQKGIRVHPISPGPLVPRAASGIVPFDEPMKDAARRSKGRMLVTIEDVGMATAFLATDHAHRITGDTMSIDGGDHIVGEPTGAIRPVPSARPPRDDDRPGSRSRASFPQTGACATSR